MARKGARNGKTNGYIPVRFLPLNLDVDDAAWLESHDLGTEFPLTIILDLAESGYKVSVAPDKANHRCICSLVNRKGDTLTNNTCISGSGADALDAWHALAYRHFVKLGEDWTSLAGDGTGEESKYG